MLLGVFRWQTKGQDMSTAWMYHKMKDSTSLVVFSVEQNVNVSVPSLARNILVHLQRHWRETCVYHGRILTQASSPSPCQLDLSSTTETTAATQALKQLSSTKTMLGPGASPNRMLPMPLNAISPVVVCAYQDIQFDLNALLTEWYQSFACPPSLYVSVEWLICV